SIIEVPAATEEEIKAPALVEIFGATRINDHHVSIVDHLKTVTLFVPALHTNEVLKKDHFSPRVMFHRCGQSAARVQAVFPVTVPVLTAGISQRLVFITVIMEPRNSIFHVYARPFED